MILTSGFCFSLREFVKYNCSLSVKLCSLYSSFLTSLAILNCKSLIYVFRRQVLSEESHEAVPDSYIDCNPVRPVDDGSNKQQLLQSM